MKEQIQALFLKDTFKYDTKRIIANVIFNDDNTIKSYELLNPNINFIGDIDYKNQWWKLICKENIYENGNKLKTNSKKHILNKSICEDIRICLNEVKKYSHCNLFISNMTIEQIKNLHEEVTNNNIKIASKKYKSDRIKALREFNKLNYHKLPDKWEMRNLYKRIFDFSKRYVFAEPIDIYVDIKHFIEDGIKEIQLGHSPWYKKDFIKAGLLE